jgi:hypothetical protein
MNMPKVTNAASAAMSALVMSLTLSAPESALADIRFRYDSLPIPWNFTSINQLESSEIGSHYTPDFSIAFNAPDSWLHPGVTTIFDIPTPTVRAWNDKRQFTLEQNGEALIRIDPAGNIVGWRFVYTLSPVFTPTSNPLEVAINQSYNIYSTNSMGSSCPCDNFTVYRNDVIYDNGMPVPSDSLISNYRDLNYYRDNWSITPVSAVPEVHAGWMMAGGLGLIGLFARGRKARWMQGGAPRMIA